jgi:hypothetical protein
MPSAHEWIDAYAERIGAPAPTPEERDAILALAGVAAHASERIAAPIACWMAGRAGLSLEEAMRAAKALAEH